MRMSYNVFSFKLVYTSQVKSYYVQLDDTIDVFINNIKNKVYDDFNINLREEDIEIIVAGNYNNTNGRDPERAPALDPRHDITFREYFGDYAKVAFYIREIRLPPQQQVLDVETDHETEHEVDDLCVICMESPPQLRFQTCGHVCTCHNCYNNLRGVSNSCPLCRQQMGTVITV